MRPALVVRERAGDVALRVVVRIGHEISLLAGYSEYGRFLLPAGGRALDAGDEVSGVGGRQPEVTADGESCFDARGGVIEVDSGGEPVGGARIRVKVIGRGP
jgi:hypothetical protein